MDVLRLLLFLRNAMSSLISFALHPQIWNAFMQIWRKSRQNGTFLSWKNAKTKWWKRNSWKIGMFFHSSCVRNVLDKCALNFLVDSSNLVSSEDWSLNYDKDLVSFFVFSFLLNSSSFPFLIFLCSLKILSLQKHTPISTHRTPSNSWILCPRLPKLPQSVPNHKL